MSRRADGRKVAEWRGRFERFRRSDRDDQLDTGLVPQDVHFLQFARRCKRRIPDLFVFVGHVFNVPVIRKGCLMAGQVGNLPYDRPTTRDDTIGIDVEQRHERRLIERDVELHLVAIFQRADFGAEHLIAFGLLCSLNVQFDSWEKSQRCVPGRAESGSMRRTRQHWPKIVAKHHPGGVATGDRRPAQQHEHQNAGQQMCRQ